jgi:alkanesulfonate monooxygenase SsuD/methylene tetrahydromethanopterin reductase-like flavin-dependent oxidoreductase (luciferase family)
MRLSLRYDMRQPDPGAPLDAYYAAAVEQCAWADGLGFETVFIAEHHGIEDGYVPSPIVLAAAIASQTNAIELHLSALIVTLHDPLRLAEDLAILDILSGGRLTITAGMGYRPHEFEMFGLDFKSRLKIYIEALEVLQQAWTGEPFEFRGRTVRVTPRPIQRPGPKLLMGGSATASAERAARMGLGYSPATPELYDIYRQECAKLGLGEPPPFAYPQPTFLFVTDDPDRDWPVVGPHVMYNSNSYVAWATERKVGGTRYTPLESIEELKAQPIFQVVTPEQCVDFARTLGPDGELSIQPLMGGLDPEVSWRSLRLFEEKVLPGLAAEGLR